MDLATIVGLIACLGFVFLGIVSGDQGMSALGNFYDLISIFITIGGTFGCILTMHTFKDFLNGLKAFTIALKIPNINEPETIKSIIELSNVARKEGLLALEEAANSVEDEFLKKGVLLIVDGTEPELVRGIMETELVCIENRHNKIIGFYEKVAEMGPAWGMIGTLIGLVNMLKNMGDVSTVGPNMAVALITTLYGSLLANWVAIPIANKLKATNSLETTLKEVMIEGLLSIQAGENPRVIEEKLKSFLSPEQRLNMQEKPEIGG